ncbi:Atrial natriuretic peptide receptor 2 [Hypsibius exemplaris]|uniref:Guanylate cyclase n=1 Tax=Hypsibius exemplaris TaxID=2072580 RepID=A0A1W0WZ23_HYPEX|nr:Atrial natriuretic peptide receptor 2 [Hypsibius exemplaris]
MAWHSSCPLTEFVLVGGSAAPSLKVLSVAVRQALLESGQGGRQFSFRRLTSRSGGDEVPESCDVLVDRLVSEWGAVGWADAQRRCSMICLLVCEERTMVITGVAEVLLFAMPSRQFQQCVTTMPDIYKACNPLIVFISTDDQDENLNPVKTLTATPQPARSIVSVKVQRDSLSINAASAKDRVRTRGFYHALSQFFSNDSRDEMLGEEMDLDFVFTWQNQVADEEILAYVNATTKYTLQTAVDKMTFQQLTQYDSAADVCNRNSDADDDLGPWNGIIYGMIGVLVVIFLAGACFACNVSRHAGSRKIGKGREHRSEEAITVDAVGDAALIIAPEEVTQVAAPKTGTSRSFVFSMTTSEQVKDWSSTEVYIYRGHKVWVKRRELSYNFVPETHQMTFIRKMKRLNHPNIANFRGIILSQDPLVYELKMVLEYCPRGSLADLIANESFDFTFALQAVLIKDIASAMTYIHNSFIVCHGSLKSPNCLINERFNVKITDYGLNAFPVHPPALAADESLYRVMLWSAPEILRGPIIRFRKGTKQADVYSFAIILQEIVNRAEPFSDTDTTFTEVPKEIVRRLIEKSAQPFRPRVAPSACPPSLRALMELAWAESPQARPSFKELSTKIEKLPGFSGNASYLDHLIDKMTEYSEQLEMRVMDATKILMEEKKLSDELLAQMMPKSVLDKLQMGLTVDPESFEEVSLGFTAVTEFAQFVTSTTPFHVVEFLNGLYHMFDDIIDTFDVYKVETIQESYVLASGLPIRNGDQHSAEVARMGIQMFHAARKYPGLKLEGQRDAVRLKLGVHTGGCVAGVIGIRAPRYCLFGDTINTTSRMCSIAKANEIVVSESTKESLERLHPGSFQLVSRGGTEVKGKGLMQTFQLLAENRQKH